MEVELIIQQNRKLKLSSFEKHLDGSGSAYLEVTSGRITYFNEEFGFDGLLEFINALQKLHKNLAGEAELRFHHASEFIKFKAQSLGRIEFSGSFIEYREPQQECSLAFNLDQSYLPSFIQQLRHVYKHIYC